MKQHLYLLNKYLLKYIKYLSFLKYHILYIIQYNIIYIFFMYYLDKDFKLFLNILENKNI